MRPTLPAAVAAEVAELDQRIAELEELGLTAPTREEQDAALDEAIQIAEESLAMRLESQGNTAEVTRWRDLEGHPSDWFEVADARRAVTNVRLLRSLDDSARGDLASLRGTDERATRLYQSAAYSRAEAIVKRQLTVRRRVLGENHPQTLDAVNGMGVLLRNQGRLTQSEEFSRLAVDRMLLALGDEHPDSLAAIDNLGTLLEWQGRLPEAETVVRRAVAGFRRVLGDEDLDTLTSVSNLGFLLESQGRLADAEPYARAALRGFRRVAGDEDPGTLMAMDHLGALLRLQGRLAEAEPYTREALDASRRVMGTNHPHTLVCLLNMSALARAKLQLREAEVLQRQAVEISRIALGPEHPDALGAINDLGLLLRMKGSLAEAEAYSRTALDLGRRVLGSDHRDTLIAVGNMGELLWTTGRLREAEPYMRESLDSSLRVLGPDHPVTLGALTGMAGLLRAQGRSTEAEPLLRQAVSTSERLRIQIAGDAATRAEYAGALGLRAVASALANLLVDSGRAGEALEVLERGRGRAALDLLGVGTESSKDPQTLGEPRAIARYGAATTAQQSAIAALRDAEARLAALSIERGAVAAATTIADDAKATQLASLDNSLDSARALIFNRRRDLGDATAAVFAELRGLIPAGNPLTTEQILADLSIHEVLLTFSWTTEAVRAITAGDGSTSGHALTLTREDVASLVLRVDVVRRGISLPPADQTCPSVEEFEAARHELTDRLFPPEVLAALAGAARVIAVMDGPLSGIPLDVLAGDEHSPLAVLPIAYAPSATIYLDRVRTKLEGQTRIGVGPAAVVLGDPIFDRHAPSESDSALPNSGVLLAMVVEDGPAAAAGLSRGDVLLSYDGLELAAPDALGPARAEVDAAIADGSRPADQPVTISYWRDGQTLSTELPPGRLGVQLSQAPAAEGLRSMRTLDQLSTERGMSEFAANASALDQIRLYGGTLDPLPGTRSEAEAIASLIPGATLLMREDATAPNLTHAVEAVHPRYVHLATHGLMGSADRPQDASLALTQPETPTPDDTGFLTLQDLLAQWGGDLKGTDLVVLSACDTGRGIQSGDTQMSLPLGFFQAGTPTVIASLWKVDDSATALLMARLYENLLGRFDSTRTVHARAYDAGQPMTKLDALDEAKAWLRGLVQADLDALFIDGRIAPSTDRGVGQATSSTGSPGAVLHPFEHPRFWAAFVLIGSPE